MLIMEQNFKLIFFTGAVVGLTAYHFTVGSGWPLYSYFKPHGWIGLDTLYEWWWF